MGEIGGARGEHGMGAEGSVLVASEFDFGAGGKAVARSRSATEEMMREGREDEGTRTKNENENEERARE